MFTSGLGYGKSPLLFFVFVLFGLYQINAGFNFVSLPAIVLSVESWITVVSGALLIVGGFIYYSRRF